MIAIICQPGFRQPWGISQGVGVSRIYDDCYKAFWNRRKVLVSLHTWDDSAESIVSLLKWHQPEYIIHVGYSYGDGEGLVSLARELLKINRHIDLACMIDPVPRYPLLLKWLSLTRHGKFELPENVKKAHLWRQVNGSPYGRDVKPYSRVTVERVFGSTENLKLYAPHDRADWSRRPDIDHGDIDQQPEVRREVGNAIGNFVSEHNHD